MCILYKKVKLNRMKKGLLLVILSLNVMALKAQYGVYAGTATFSPLGTGKTFYGFNLGAEIPRDDETTLYLRGCFFGKRINEGGENQFEIINKQDPTDFSFISSKSYTNYSTFEGGLRRYINGTFDSDFALYGGTNLLGIFSQIKSKYEDFDKSIYKVVNSKGDAIDINRPNSLFAFAIGLNGGAKYTFPGIGTIFFDAGISYVIQSVGSSNFYATYHSPLNFNTCLGFRKEIY